MYNNVLLYCKVLDKSGVARTFFLHPCISLVNRCERFCTSRCTYSDASHFAATQRQRESGNMSESDFVMVDRPERGGAASEAAASKVGETPAKEEPQTTQEHAEEAREKEQETVREEKEAEEDEREGAGVGGSQPESDSDDDVVTEPQATDMAAEEDAPAPEPKQGGNACKITWDKNIISLKNIYTCIASLFGIIIEHEGIFVND